MLVGGPEEEVQIDAEFSELLEGSSLGSAAARYIRAVGRRDSEADMDVRKFRALMVQQHQAHEQEAEKYTRLVREIPQGAEGTPESEALRAAWLGHSMAANYSYTVAGILRLVERAGGAEMAEGIALEAQFIIEDGDDGGINADVAPLIHQSALVADLAATLHLNVGLAQIIEQDANETPHE